MFHCHSVRCAVVRLLSRHCQLPAHLRLRITHSHNQEIHYFSRIFVPPQGTSWKQQRKTKKDKKRKATDRNPYIKPNVLIKPEAGPVQRTDPEAKM